MNDCHSDDDEHHACVFHYVCLVYTCNNILIWSVRLTTSLNGSGFKTILFSFLIRSMI